MNRPGHRVAACLGKAALKTHALQTLRDRRASPNRAKRLECVRFIGAFRPARDNLRFMAAMHDVGIVEASHQSTHPLPLPESVCRAVGILPAKRDDSCLNDLPARCRQHLTRHLQAPLNRYQGRGPG